MKFLTILTFISVASALDIGKLLGGLKPLMKKAKCVAPALAASANKLKCNANGPVATICENIDKIVQDSEPSLKKCGVDKSMTRIVVKLTKDLCGGNPKRSLTARQDPNLCKSCGDDCKKNGCVEDKDCDYCELVCQLLCEGPA